MTAPRLLIRKRMQLIQGKMRACCFVQAIVEPELQALLEEHAHQEPLFKRSAYSVNWPKTAIPVPAALAPPLSAFLKNDACPEITVRTLLAGQLHQALSVWDMMCFELIAKLAFDNFLAIVATCAEFDRDVVFTGTLKAQDVAAFEADTAAELRALAGSDLAA